MVDYTDQMAADSSIKKTLMKAILCQKYGPPDVLQLKEVEKPSPKDDEILIKIHNTTVTSGDCRVRGLNTPLGFKGLMRLALGFNQPRQPILGTELAGTVEAIGRNITQYQVGNAVFAFTDIKMGCYAEYICLPEQGAVLPKPVNLSFEEAAALSFGGTTALHFLTKAQLKIGEKLLINGASGCVGMAAIQLAKHFGAEVTGVCSSVNVAVVQALGADKVIDYTKEDLTQQVSRYDVVFDATGKLSYQRGKFFLKVGGRLVLISASLPEILMIPWIALTSNNKVLAGPAKSDKTSLRVLADLAMQGKYRPVIDQCFPFERMIEAHHYVDKGHKKGNVVIKLV